MDGKAVDLYEQITFSLKLILRVSVTETSVLSSISFNLKTCHPIVPLQIIQIYIITCDVMVVRNKWLYMLKC